LRHFVLVFSAVHSNVTAIKKIGQNITFKRRKRGCPDQQRYASAYDFMYIYIQT